VIPVDRSGDHAQRPSSTPWLSRRWENYVLASDTDASDRLWQAATPQDGMTTLVTGVGFDPRALDVARQMSRRLGAHLRVLAITVPGGNDDPATSRLAASNRVELQGLLGGRVIFIPPVEVEDSRNAGIRLARDLAAAPYKLLDEQHVVVDVSALPSSITFPVIRLFLRQSEPGAQPPFNGDLQVTVSEDPDIDARIIPLGLDQPASVPGFARLADSNVTRVWVPVLGEGRGEQLRAVREFLEPSEVCPVLPFPAKRARRSDDLLLEHRTLLFDDLALEPRNILFAAERNPFDLYRQLCDLAQRYRRALSPLGGATIVVSQHSSKLLSLGALLAAHEAELVVVHVRPTGYGLAPPKGEVAPQDNSNVAAPLLHTAWLAGQPYNDHGRT
jgi:hypothetical protein